MRRMCAPFAKSVALVEELLNKWLKPKVNAEVWDNVGLLVGSGIHRKEDKSVSSILLCNDLTLDVVNEAIDKQVSMIIAYHPPIFVPLKSVGYNTLKESIIARCIAHDIVVYSPHTALDSVHGGINDRVSWKLGDLRSPGESAVVPRTGASTLNGLEFICTSDECRDLVNIFNKNDSVHYGFEFPEPFDGLALTCGEDPPRMIVRAFHELPLNEVKFGDELLNLKLYNDYSAAVPYSPGCGRWLRFKEPKPFDQFLSETRSFFKVDYMQLGFGGKKLIGKVAFCAGSGGSVLKGVDADVVLTGELSHHEILDNVARGVTVALLGHCNSERHYLPTLAKTLEVLLNIPTVLISQKDTSPLYAYI